MAKGKIPEVGDVFEGDPKWAVQTAEMVSNHPLLEIHDPAKTRLSVHSQTELDLTKARRGALAGKRFVVMRVQRESAGDIPATLLQYRQSGWWGYAGTEIWAKEVNAGGGVLDEKAPSYIFYQGSPFPEANLTPAPKIVGHADLDVKTVTTRTASPVRWARSKAGRAAQAKTAPAQG